jgi:uncharacterized protein
MLFLDRQAELSRLRRFEATPGSGLAVLYGRRRVGKTRLLLEWVAKTDGLYTVADQSTADIQRRFLAEVLATRLPGFAEVDYPSWGVLLARLARDATTRGWRGPLILDELPYLVAVSPELPSVLQRWLDHEAAAAGLKVVLAGSSQRMMQGLVLAGNAPLYGRAQEILPLRPLPASYLAEAFAIPNGRTWVELYAAWGGVPRYWELAQPLGGTVPEQLEQLVLDPLGPLHDEPERLLLEETPSALEVRPLLDALGGGAHRLSEIAGRLGRPATAMSRPLERLLSLGLARREVPFGENERTGKRTLYQIDDPFVRLWFRVVAPHRAQLRSGTPRSRRLRLEASWEALVAAAWEDLCREQIPRLEGPSPLAALGPWGPAARWWYRNEPEWDLVAESIDGERLLLGEAKCPLEPLTARDLTRLRQELATRPAPPLPDRFRHHQVVRALFLPDAPNLPTTSGTGEPLVVTGAELRTAEE